MGKTRVIWLLMFALIINLSMGIISAEGIRMDIGDNYFPGEEARLLISIYDENGDKIDGLIQFIVQDYYTDIFKQGEVYSGEELVFKLPGDARRGLWKVSASYGEMTGEAWFNIQELEKAEIKLEGDRLIVRNVGNIPYGKPISISIGGHSETALVRLGVGQTKEVRLTAPEGEYDIKISDGTIENTFEVQGVGLTGNVVGLEKSNQGFLEKYSLVSLFLGVLGLVIAVVLGLKIHNRFSK